MGGGLLILLPKDQDATKLMESMTWSRFTIISSNLQDGAGTLQLPRFEIQTQAMDLSDALIAMGIPLFDEKTAPLTGGLLTEPDPTWVDQAVQKVMIKVDEKGTTAAAVTVVSITRESLPAPFEMICDSPFAFVLHAPTVDGGEQVLFTGVVNEP
jgi:serpin B